MAIARFGSRQINRANADNARTSRATGSVYTSTLAPMKVDLTVIATGRNHTNLMMTHHINLTITKHLQDIPRRKGKIS